MVLRKVFYIAKSLLIDKQGRIRGIYDGTDKIQVKKLIGDIKLLSGEIGVTHSKFLYNSYFRINVTFCNL